LRMIAIPKSPLSDRIFATHAGPEQAAGWWMNEVRMGERLCQKHLVRGVPAAGSCNRQVSFAADLL
jgi:hypothetical protein